MNTTNQINQYYKGNSSGGTMTMKKKYGNKFNKITSNGMFSLNSSINQYYTGKSNYPNNNFIDCKSSSSTPKSLVSVKSQFSLMKTRLKNNNEMYCNPVISFECQKKLTHPSTSTVPDDSYNIIYTKIIKTEHQDYSHYLQNRISNCDIFKEISDIPITTNNCRIQNSINTTTNGRLNNLTRTCQVTKDIKGVKVNKDYSEHLIMLKNKNNCFNPKNANTKICRIY